MPVSTDAPIPHVRALWRPEQFTRISNLGFETNTTGWSVSAGGINNAGTSITRITTDFHTGSACGSLVCPTATYDAGVNFDLGSDTYFQEQTYGTTYAALVWLKRVSGGTRAKITLGSEGTSDRATSIVDLSDSWRAFRVMWRPGDNYTDVQFAVTNAQSDALTVRIDDVLIYQVDAFSQVENSNFINDTTNWITASGISGAATSLTRVTSDGMDPDQQTAATLVTTATSGSGVDYNLGNRRFTAGRTYTLRAALKSISGSTSARLRLGSLSAGSPGDSGAFTITTSWAWYTVNWTPSANRTDAKAAISNGSAAVATFRVGFVEVYEATDDFGAAYVAGMNIKRGDNFDGSATTGSLELTANDLAALYDPHNAASALYGSVVAGRRLWARCTYAGSVYPLFFGSITKIEPRIWEKQVDFQAQDLFYDFGLTAISDPSFVQDDPYWIQRWNQVGGDRRIYDGMAKDSLEAGCFYMQADTSTDVLTFLEMVNEANGTAHYIHPRATAEHLYLYTTVTRPTLTDASASDETINDDFMDLTGYAFTDDALENHQFIPWQGYEQLADLGDIARAADRGRYGGDVVGEDDPYLHYVDERYGSNSSVPEPAFESTKRRIHHRRHHHEGRRKHPQRHFKTINTRIFPDAFVPFTIPASSVKTITVDFDIPMSGTFVCIDAASSDDETFVVTTSSATPRQIIAKLYSDASPRTIELLQILGTPWEPQDQMLEERALWDSILDKGDHQGPSINGSYIPSLAHAQGLGDYRNWRWGTARLRLRLAVQHRFPSSVLREVTDHLTLNAARWNISGSVFVIRGLEMQLTRDRLWTTFYDVEELPSDGGPWVTIDGTSGQGINGTAVLAY